MNTRRQVRLQHNRQMAQAQAQQDLQDRLGKDLRNLQIIAFSPGQVSNVREWIESFLNRKAALGIPDDRGCRLLRALMAGEALDWVRQLDPQVQNNFQQMCDQFRERFLIRNHFSLQSRKADYFQLQQAAGESVKAFASRLKELGYLLNIPQEDLKAKFQSSLLPNIREKIGLHSPANLDVAIALAEEAERHSVTQDQNYHVMAAPAPAQPTTTEMTLVLQKLDTLTAEFDKIKSEKTYQGRQPQRQPRRVRFDKSPVTRGRSPGPVVCYKCQQPNHVAKFCLARDKVPRPISPGTGDDQTPNQLN